MLYYYKIVKYSRVKTNGDKVYQQNYYYKITIEEVINVKKMILKLSNACPVRMQSVTYSLYTQVYHITSDQMYHTEI